MTYKKHPRKFGSNQLYPGQIVRQRLDFKGYPIVMLSCDGKKKSPRVHRLVALAFVPPIAGKDQVNHIDGVKTNSAASNLEWCTNLENMRHAYRLGLFRAKGPRGGNTGNRVGFAKKLDIVRMVCGGSSLAEASRKFGVTDRTIRKIVACAKQYHEAVNQPT
jgi:hypothetical protein